MSLKWEMEVLSPSSSYPSSSSMNWFTNNDNKARWTPAENKMFENALALNDKDTPDRWLRVAKMIPGKTVEDVKRHYRELEVDVNNIEAGLIPIPGYYNTSTSPFTLEWVNSYGFDGQPYGKRSTAVRLPEQERKKGVPWTEEEHKLFLMGLNKYGKGDWRNISRNYVVTRTPTQVASHAQKYFIRQLSGGKDKRRASIHDITTVNLANTRSTTPCPDTNKASPDQSASTSILSQSPSSAPNIPWNQPNDNGGLMVFRGNAPVYDANSYAGLKTQEQNLHQSGNVINGSYSYTRNQNPNNFQLESVQQHYPHGG